MSRDQGRVRKFGRGVTLKYQARTFVKRLHNYFEQERNNNGPLQRVQNVTQRVADALQISRNTVSNISAETTEITPGKKRPRQSPKSGLDSFSESAIRNHIYEYYKKKELPTRRNLIRSLSDCDLFNGSTTTLSRILKKLGFKWKRINNRQFLMERNDIVSLRCNFLRKIKNIDLDRVIFLDETWINAGHTVSKSWSDSTVYSSRKEPTGKGERIIITHAGSSDGFVSNALLMFRCKKEGEYHQEMNGIVFETWFQNLLNNIKPGSVIMMDNAPYHSIQVNKAPTQCSTKTTIIDWLKKNNIEFGLDLRKPELLDIVKKNKTEFKKYQLDEIAKNKGHTVIRIPPYHCQFNAIELIWANVKGKVARRNKTFTISEVERLATEAIQEISINDWKNAVNHVKQIINEAWRTDIAVEQSVDELIVDLGNDSSSTSESEEYSSEEEDEREDFCEPSTSGTFNISGIQPLPSGSDSD